jgi:hypothetical protein
MTTAILGVNLINTTFYKIRIYGYDRYGDEVAEVLGE